METKKESWREDLASFLDKNSNLILIAIILFTVIIRLKYLTINQAVWYDEAEYLSTARYWAFSHPEYQLHFVRPPLLPFILAIFYKLGASEIFFRITMLLSSTIAVFFTYLIGKELINKKVALLSTFILSFFYVSLFYTARIMTDLPSMTIWLIAVWSFWKGYIKKESRKHVWLFGFLVSVGILMKFPYGLLVIVIILYLLLTEKFRFLKDKDLWIAAFIGIISMIPYSIWYIKVYNKIPILGAAEFYESVSYFKVYIFDIIPMVLQSPFPGVTELFPKFSFLVILFILGFILVLLDVLIGYNLAAKNEQIRKYLFILLWILVPFSYFAFIAGQVPEDRYLFYIYPAMFYLISLAAVYLYEKIRRIHKYAGVIAIMVLCLVFFSIFSTQLQVADNLIKVKSSSYIQFKNAGNWINENSDADDQVVAAGVPQLSYYSERKIIYWPSKKEEFEELIGNKNIKYIVLSVLEGSPEWSYDWPEENKNRVTLVQAHFADKEKTRPILVVYKFLDR
ncbi:glycosyltransferase family 39 protein [Candidatus Woesearchaeota archaeon]|nr:glycosyltransferase family 39 protein [Candidatus Woesearchaeota archaeon]